MGDFFGTVNIKKDAAGDIIIRLNPETAALHVGKDKELLLLSESGGEIRFRTADGTERARIVTTGNGIAIQDEKGKDVIRIDCNERVLGIGGNGHPGQIFLRDEHGVTTARLEAEEGGFIVGDSLRFVQADHVATLRVGAGGQHGVLSLKDSDAIETIKLDGQVGDIILANADCAEDFDVARDVEVEPGMVVVFDDNGQLRPCRDAYDGRVAGVVSGAGACRPALVLDRRSRRGGHATVGLMGKVYCRVDADVAPIRAGAMLTTSARLGHAQVAIDRDRAFGAVLGKALVSLDRGAGLIPVLITLQ